MPHHSAAAPAGEETVDHGAMDHGAMQHPSSSRAIPQGSEHGDHDTTAHSAAAHAAIPPGGLWGPIPGAGPSAPQQVPLLPMAPAPTSSSEMTRVDPQQTLSGDRADTPAAISVREAKKSAEGEGEGEHAGHGDSPAPPHQHPPDGDGLR